MNFADILMNFVNNTYQNLNCVKNKHVFSAVFNYINQTYYKTVQNLSVANSFCIDSKLFTATFTFSNRHFELIFEAFLPTLISLILLWQKNGNLLSKLNMY